MTPQKKTTTTAAALDTALVPQPVAQVAPDAHFER